MTSANVNSWIYRETVDVKKFTETDLPHTLGRSHMNKIIYIGMDVHSTNFTLCSHEPRYGFEADKSFGQTQIKEDIFNSTVKLRQPNEADRYHKNC